MTGHDPALVADVSDGDQVVDGVTPPTDAELKAAASATYDDVRALIDAHVEEVSIHDDRHG